MTSSFFCFALIGFSIGLIYSTVSNTVSTVTSLFKSFCSSIAFSLERFLSPPKQVFSYSKVNQVQRTNVFKPVFFGPAIMVKS